VRLIDYCFVLSGWQPEGVTVHRTGCDLTFHNGLSYADNGLSYVEFYAETNQGRVSVRCDPCSLDQDQAAYATMVRLDLERALRKTAVTTIQP
jgi:hypothetical protein